MSGRCVAVAVACLIIIGCSPAVLPQQGKIAAGQTVVCETVRRTGSNLPRQECTTVAEREAERTESQRTLEKKVFRPTGPKNPSSL